MRAWILGASALVTVACGGTPFSGQDSFSDAGSVVSSDPIDGDAGPLKTVQNDSGSVSSLDSGAGEVDASKPSQDAGTVEDASTGQEDAATSGAATPVDSGPDLVCPSGCTFVASQNNLCDNYGFSGSYWAECSTAPAAPNCEQVNTPHAFDEYCCIPCH